MPLDPRSKEEEVTRQRAELMGSPYQDARTAEPIPLEGLLDLAEIKQQRVIPLGASPHQLELGFTITTPKGNLDTVKEKLRTFNLRLSLISETGFTELLERYQQKYQPPQPKNQQALSDKLAANILETTSRAFDPELFTKTLAETTQPDLFQLITQQAYLIGASDIHIEPTKAATRVRFRIDGALHDIGTLPAERTATLLNNLQIESGIKWNSDKPQTGHTSRQLLDAKGQTVAVNMRIETVPTKYGSDVVVRIFNVDVRYLKLDNLGLALTHRQQIDRLITHPHGMILTVGPTGSGKTSTQYAILNQLNQSDVKIITLEDPVEYELTGVTQLAVKSDQGEAFSEKLRAVLREDPDIIMIGEVRDADTAKTALQAALTGHLLLSTFHANSAAAAVTRLLDMIEHEGSLLSSAIKLIMAQRLVRRLCPHCKEAYSPSSAELSEIKPILDSLPAEIRPSLEKLQLYRAKGCPKCYHIGYRGRIMIAEQLVISDEIAQMISSSTKNLTTQEVEAAALKQGMVTLFQDAVLKVVAGITSLEEVFRVVES